MRYLAFPDDEHPPARGFKSFKVLLIPFDVARNFGQPVAQIRFRLASHTFAGVAMPKAAMNEDCALAADIGDIWSASQVFSVQAIADMPKLTAEASNPEFGLGILRPDQAHTLTALSRSKRIGHTSRKSDSEGFQSRA